MVEYGAVTEAFEQGGKPERGLEIFDEMVGSLLFRFCVSYYCRRGRVFFRFVSVCNVVRLVTSATTPLLLRWCILLCSAVCVDRQLSGRPSLAVCVIIFRTAVHVRYLVFKRSTA